MRINSTNFSGKVRPVRKRAGDSGSSGKFAVKAGEAEAANETPALIATPVSGEGLLLLQGGEESSLRQAVSSGEQTISGLEKILMGMLEQEPSIDDLKQLKRLVRAVPAVSGNAELDATLALIRQRAAIEVAKLEMVLGSKS